MNCFLCLCGNADHLKQGTPATTCLLPGSDPASWETGLRQKMWCRHRQRIGADAGLRQNSDSDPIANDPQTADRSTSTPWLRPTSPTQACVKTVKTVMQGQPSRTHRHNTQTLILILQVKFQNQNLMMSPIKMCARRGLSQWKKIESISRTVFEKSPKNHLKEPISRKLVWLICSAWQQTDWVIHWWNFPIQERSDSKCFSAKNRFCLCALQWRVILWFLGFTLEGFSGSGWIIVSVILFVC